MSEKTCHGSCLCGTVRWTVKPPYSGMSHCHCSMCRKAHGAPFATYMGARRENLTFEAGEEAIVDYESSPGFHRAFCRSCGSAVPGVPTPELDPDLIEIPTGTLEDDPGIRASKHIFATHKAPWHQIGGDLPQWPTYKEDGSGEVVERPALEPAKEGVLRGSCLCGATAYEIDQPLGAIFNCHCSRCRKARAAAHTTNGFVPAAALRYTRGEELIKSYKLPEAERFSQSFCSICGSGMPPTGRTEGMVSIPLGSLDDDPHRFADAHIFVGSKAAWYDPEDDLPKFEERPPAKG